ncbi:hypothetical protein GGR16_003145 [Chelatococcus caeni]|uniref:Uncharacterized protein n=1 Tax=Chelatococcus caeni TaxID=1348468 RepID=A0A840BX73_9HYPH|nr:hypothetical protein [Chelatococcus caeni]MBB4018111.1 hypothetical protein [Chelatococcus caeni]
MHRYDRLEPAVRVAKERDLLVIPKCGRCHQHDIFLPIGRNNSARRRGSTQKEEIKPLYLNNLQEIATAQRSYLETTWPDFIAAGALLSGQFYDMPGRTALHNITTIDE